MQKAPDDSMETNAGDVTGIGTAPADSPSCLLGPKFDIWVVSCKLCWLCSPEDLRMERISLELRDFSRVGAWCSSLGACGEGIPAANAHKPTATTARQKLLVRRQCGYERQALR